MEGEVGQSERAELPVAWGVSVEPRGVLATAPLSPLFPTYSRSDVAHIVPQLLVSVGK